MEDKQEQEEVKEQKEKKFVAVVMGDDGEIVFNINGISMDEALLLLIKGKVKFEKIHEKWLRENIN